MVNYDENIYLDQNRDLKLFYKEYVGKPMFSPLITYDKMKDCYPFQINDLRFQVDHLSPKKIGFMKNMMIIQLILIYKYS